MNPSEIAMNITVAWINQRGALTSSQASKEIKEVYKAALEAARERSSD